jgi:hypothetical protein
VRSSAEEAAAALYRAQLSKLRLLSIDAKITSSAGHLTIFAKDAEEQDTVRTAPGAGGGASAGAAARGVGGDHALGGGGGAQGKAGASQARVNGDYIGKQLLFACFSDYIGKRLLL